MPHPAEAANAFGNGELYMEKFIEQPRHIEFQVLADEHGNVATLFERECSIQRRHQKLIEEAPIAPGHAADARGDRQDPRRCLTDIGYQNAGTVEFLMDEDGKLYFIEMNTRIQVEHPVTEVDHRRRPGQGPAPHRRRREALRHPAPQARNPRPRHRVPHQRRAPATNSRPRAGKITVFNVPGGNGVRVDTAQYSEGVVPPYYDSLIAKLICLRRRSRRSHGPDASAPFSSSSCRASTPRSRSTRPSSRRRLPRRQVRHQVHGALLRPPDAEVNVRGLTPIISELSF